MNKGENNSMSDNPNPIPDSNAKSEKNDQDVEIKKVNELIERKLNEENNASELTPLKIDSKPEWTTFSIQESTGFKPLKASAIDTITRESKAINILIYEIFESILDTCLHNYAFATQKLPFETYMAFYQEINRLMPTLKAKFRRDNAYSSVFFVGDTHGSIEDSFLIINFFLKIIQKDPKIKVVFVGDYVDRNPWDLENLTLTLAFFLLCPNNVILLRGNHEDRSINLNYGFYDNLLRSYYENGEKLYDEIIKVFIHLPLAEITLMHNKDGQSVARVLSVHGGIPVDWQNFSQPIILDQVEANLQCEKERSEEMDPLSVSILWSDPDEMIQGIVTDGDSGRMRFGYQVLSKFLTANNIHLVVRGHQKWNDGFKIFFGGYLYSLFSTSKYDDKKKFEPKILQLELNKQPKLIPINAEILNKEINEYKV